MNESTLDGLVAVGAGAYLLAVCYQGNFWPFWHQLLTETGYIQFVIAAAVLAFVVQNDTTGLAVPIIGLGVLSVALMIATNSNFGSVLNDFGAGRKNLFQTIKGLIGG